MSLGCGGLDRLGRRRKARPLRAARCPPLVAAAFASLLAAGSAHAAEGIDVARGHELAHEWCSECHQVEPGRLIGPYSDVPSFTAVARQNSTTETAIRAFLATPHPNMPNVKLTPGETDEIVDYILSLR